MSRTASTQQQPHSVLNAFDRGFVVRHQEIHLTIDPSTWQSPSMPTFYGRTRLTCVRKQRPLPKGNLYINARQMHINQVSLNGRPVSFEYNGEGMGIAGDRVTDVGLLLKRYGKIWDEATHGNLVIPFVPAANEETFTLDIVYELRHFVGGLFMCRAPHDDTDEIQVFTDDAPYAQRLWVPTVDDFGCIFSLTFTAAVPQGWTVAASGLLTSCGPSSSAQGMVNGGPLIEWKFDMDRPVHVRSIGFWASSSRITHSPHVAKFEDQPNMHINCFTSSRLAPEVDMMTTNTAMAPLFIEHLAGYLRQPPHSLFPGTCSVVFSDHIPSDVLSFSGLIIMHSRFMLASSSQLDSPNRIRTSYSTFFFGVSMACVKHLFSVAAYSDLWLEEALAWSFADTYYQEFFGVNDYMLTIRDIRDTFARPLDIEDHHLSFVRSFLWAGSLRTMDIYGVAALPDRVPWNGEAARPHLEDPLWHTAYVQPAEMVSHKKTLYTRLASHHVRKILRDSFWQVVMQHVVMFATSAQYGPLEEPWERLLLTSQFFSYVRTLARTDGQSFDDDQLNSFMNRCVFNPPVFSTVRGAYLYDLKTTKIRFSLHLHPFSSYMDGPLSVMSREKNDLVPHMVEIRGDKSYAELEVRTKMKNVPLTMPGAPMVADSMSMWTSSDGPLKFPIYYMRIDPLMETDYVPCMRSTLKSVLAAIGDSEFADVGTILEALDNLASLYIDYDNFVETGIQQIESKSTLDAQRQAAVQLCSRMVRAELSPVHVAIRLKAASVLCQLALHGVYDSSEVLIREMEYLSAKALQLSGEDQWAWNDVLVGLCVSLSKLSRKYPRIADVLFQHIERNVTNPLVPVDTRAALVSVVCTCGLDPRSPNYTTFSKNRIGLLTHVLKSSPDEALLVSVLLSLPYVFVHEPLSPAFLNTFLNSYILPFALLPSSPEVRAAACTALLHLTPDDGVTVFFIVEGVTRASPNPYTYLSFLQLLRSYLGYNQSFLSSIRTDPAFASRYKQLWTELVTSPAADADGRFLTAALEFIVHIAGPVAPPSVSTSNNLETWLNKTALTRSMSLTTPVNLTGGFPMPAAPGSVSVVSGDGFPVALAVEEKPKVKKEKDTAERRHSTVSRADHTPAGGMTPAMSTPAGPEVSRASSSAAAAARVEHVVPKPLPLRVQQFHPAPHDVKLLLRLGAKYWGTVFLDASIPFCHHFAQQLPAMKDGIWHERRLLRFGYVPDPHHYGMLELEPTKGVTYLLPGQIAYWPFKEMPEILVYIGNDKGDKYPLSEPCLLIGSFACGSPTDNQKLHAYYSSSGQEFSKFAKAVIRDHGSSPFLPMVWMHFPRLLLNVAQNTSAEADIPEASISPKTIQVAVDFIPTQRGLDLLDLLIEFVARGTPALPDSFSWTNHGYQLAYFFVTPPPTPHNHYFERLSKNKSTEFARTVLQFGDVAVWVPKANTPEERSVFTCVGYGRSLLDPVQCKLMQGADCELVAYCAPMNAGEDVLETLRTTEDGWKASFALPSDISVVSLSLVFPDASKNLEYAIIVQRSLAIGRTFADLVKAAAPASASATDPVPAISFLNKICYFTCSPVAASYKMNTKGEYPRYVLREGEVALWYYVAEARWCVLVGYNQEGAGALGVAEGEVCYIVGRIAGWSNEMRDQWKHAMGAGAPLPAAIDGSVVPQAFMESSGPPPQAQLKFLM